MQSSAERKPSAPFAPTVALAVGGAGIVAVVLAATIRSTYPVGEGSRSAAVSELRGDPAGVVAPLPAPSAEPPRPPPVWRVSALAGDPTVQVTDGVVGRRPFLGALGTLGLSSSESYRLVRAFNDVRHFEHCGPKDALTVAKDRATGKLVAFEYAESPEEVWQARRDETGELVAKKLDLHVEASRVAVGVAVGDDLHGSIKQAGLDDGILALLDDALDGHAELTDLRPGARLRLLATEDRVDGAFLQYASIEAVEYTPAGSGAAVRVYHYGHSAGGALDGTAHDQHPHAATGFYYDAHGRQPYHGGWRTPVPMARIASRFNPHRMHPILHVVMPHNGVDFAAPPGTPVYSAAGGTVKSAGDGGACGNMVQLFHANGYVTAYCHLSRFAAGLHAGQHVEPRQLVGYVGQTGRATGPHLHFAVKKNDVFVDPLALKLDGVRVVPLSDRADFDRLRAEFDVALEAVSLPAASASPAAPEPEAGTDEILEDPP